MQSEDPTQARLKDQAELERKAREAREAGKATAFDAAREGQAKYEETKVRFFSLSEAFASVLIFRAGCGEGQGEPGSSRGGVCGSRRARQAR